MRLFETKSLKRLFDYGFAEDEVLFFGGFPGKRWWKSLILNQRKIGVTLCFLHWPAGEAGFGAGPAKLLT